MVNSTGAERGNPNNEPIRYIVVPGRGRTMNGTALTAAARLRAVEAARAFKELGLENLGGRIIVSGYKSPADTAGQRDIFLQGYNGIPEADLLKKVVMAEGVPEASVCIERDSVDTVTNFTFLESGNYFPGDGAVAIVSQKEHLQRILRIIAPKVLKRPYVGIVAPEAGATDHDSMWASLFSRVVLMGISPSTPDSAIITNKRVGMLWNIANILRWGRPYK